MNKIKHSILSGLLLSTYSLAATIYEQATTTLISPHPTSINANRDLVGWNNFINRCKTTDWYLVLAITPEVIKSFRPERITQCFFGDDTLGCKETLTIAGSQAQRKKIDWLADYFGLPTDFVSKVHFRPRVTTYLVDLSGYVGLDSWCKGLYIRAHSPIEHTRWDLNLAEYIVHTGTAGYQAGYFASTEIERSQLFGCFTQFAKGSQLKNLNGITFEPLHAAKMCPHSHAKTRLSDIELDIGYNPLCCDTYHLGFNARLILPTGNAPYGEYLFEPIVGNGHHWGLGFGLSAHCLLWKSCDEEEKAEVFLDVNFTHLFNARQRRSFDLINKPNSRYMLAAQYTSDVQKGLVGNVNNTFVVPKQQFNGTYAPVANLTTFHVNVSTAIQADLALMIAYTKCETSWIFGYGFWARSCEKIRTACCPPLIQSSWALKGDAQMYGFENNMSNSAIPLSATQNKATINSGKNFPKSGALTPNEVELGQKNNSIDNPRPAFSNTAGNGLNADFTMPGGSSTINTSIQPKILTCADIDFNSANSYGMAQKIVGQFDYTWSDRHPYTPYVGFGAEVEFGRNAQKKEPHQLQKCINCALSFWGIWFKGGFYFGS